MNTQNFVQEKLMRQHTSIGKLQSLLVKRTNDDDDDDVDGRMNTARIADDRQTKENSYHSAIALDPHESHFQTGLNISFCSFSYCRHFVIRAFFIFDACKNATLPHHSI